MIPFLEEKKNIRKTWLLMSSFFIFIILIGWFFSSVYKNPSIFYTALIFSLGMNFISYFFSDKVALSLSGAKKVNVKNKDDVRAIRAVENMSMVAGIPMPQVYIIEDQSINAFATGRGPKHSAVAVSRGLLENLDKLELEGVVAHEIAHIKNRDILLMSTVVVLVGFIAILADLAMRGAFLGRKGGKNNDIFILILGIIFSILAPIVAKIIQLAISRKREYLADATGAEISRHPEGLAKALEKISQQGIKMKRAGTATAHLYISNPFGDEKKTEVNFLERIFSTHPPIQKRISLLKQMNKF